MAETLLTSFSGSGVKISKIESVCPQPAWTSLLATGGSLSDISSCLHGTALQQAGSSGLEGTQTNERAWEVTDSGFAKGLITSETHKAALDPDCCCDPIPSLQRVPDSAEFGSGHCGEIPHLPLSSWDFMNAEISRCLLHCSCLL